MLVDERLTGRADRLAMLGRDLLSATALAVLAAGAPARADLRDVRAGVAGDRAEIAIEFDAPPSLSSAAPSPDGLIVFAGGVAAQPRMIETASQSLIRMIRVRESEGGVELDVVLAAEASAARARVDGRFLRIEVALTEAWSGQAAAYAGAPAPAAAAGAPALASSAPAAGAPSDAAQIAAGWDEPAVGAAAASAAPTSAAPGAAAPAAQTYAAADPAAAAATPGAAPAAAGAASPASSAAPPASGAPAVSSSAPGAVASAAPTPAAPRAAAPEAGGAAAAAAPPQPRTSAEAFAAAAPTAAPPPAAPSSAGVDAAAAAFAAEAAGLRLGGASDPSAATPSPTDAGGLSFAPAYVRAMQEAASSEAPRPALDLSRPAAVFAGALSREDCEAADEAVRADPWNLPALKRYAACLALDDDPVSAETVFRRLLTFTPDDTEVELGLAVALHERGEVEAAAAVYQRLLEDTTADAQAAQLRALLAIAASGG
jgi:hypothetical protein